MVPDTFIIYTGTFLMPTLAYSLFVLVNHFTVEDKEHTAWKNFLVAILIPVSWYVFSQVILPLWRPFASNFREHVLIIFILTGTLLFLFFLIRGVYILTLKRASSWKRFRLPFKIIIAVVFPLLGLAINNGDISYKGLDGIFGDFGSFWFYALALINGLFICLPDNNHKGYRLFLFLGRSITFAYTFYFFIVFLPYLPLSVLAIAAVGLGFLMLTPLVLFVIHVHDLSMDFIFLKAYFKSSNLLIAAMAGFLILPAFLTLNYRHDRRVLNETLDYLYNPNYAVEYAIDTVSLRKTLDVIIDHKDRNNFVLLGTQTPYLSSFYNWLVLDNLTLSDAKINKIENIFFGESSFQLWNEEVRNDKVEISKISSHSSYDPSEKSWRSWVDLEITNLNQNNRFAEYATTLDLPEGTWISNYYLYVGDRKERGILAEKKSAMWIFSQIRNQNRDPGLLYYLTGNQVAFRVFPFAKDEVRRTGIEFIHKEPITLQFDGEKIALGNEEETMPADFENENLIYISGKQKATLGKVQRKPYFHFIIDASQGKTVAITDFKHRIDLLSEKHPSLFKGAKISFTNSYVSTINLDSDWKQKYKEQSFYGGFYLDRAIKSALFNSYKENSSSYPVIVVVAEGLSHAILDKDFSDLAFTFPESDRFFLLNQEGNLEAHSLTSNPKKALMDSTGITFEHSVLKYKSKDNTLAYLPVNTKPSIVLKNDLFEAVNLE
ncbi:MAG: MSEP-CTERM sorting domain-containing protein, partial [Cyclobacteriaceae bacterium]|nr:MSEP-CTERM sorting domain-containing protein [Cyclobacteriaceae bacterium]